MSDDKRTALKEAIRLVRRAENTATFYGGTSGTREASEAAYNHALKLADEMAQELDRAHAAIRTAARALRGLPGTYTVGPGNALRVVDLLISDAADVAAGLELDVATRPGVQIGSHNTQTNHFH